MYFRASPESLLDDAITAEKTHGMNSTTRKAMDKLQPFVAAIVQYGEAVDVYSNTYSLALAPIWGSIKVLLHVSSWRVSNYSPKLILVSDRSHVNSASTLTSLSTCLRELVMSYRDSELMRDYSPTMTVLSKHSQWHIWSLSSSAPMPKPYSDVDSGRLVSYPWTKVAQIRAPLAWILQGTYMTAHCCSMFNLIEKI